MKIKGNFFLSELSMVRIKNRIWSLIKDFFYFQRAIEGPIVRNLYYSGYSSQKRVLIFYLSDGFFRELDFNEGGRTVQFEIFRIVNVFGNLGYCVDLINYNDTRAISLLGKQRYNFVFGFGEAFYQFVKYRSDVISILYMTENHPEFSYREEKIRTEYFKVRHGKHVPLVRSGRFYKLEHLSKTYDFLITLGEIKPFENQYKNPYTIFPSGFSPFGYKLPEKNFLNARRNFLWLGSDAVIHKGLDLLVDIFSSRDDIVLHICGLNKAARELLGIRKKENIHDYGFVNVQSNVFHSIAEQCAYSILPSCSEACATSITTSMSYGLIPVVIKDSGFNRLNVNAVFLEDYKIDYIDKVLTDLSKKNPSELETFSQQVKNFASANFTLEAFESHFRKIILQIIERQGNVIDSNDES
jgi:hypothetical protein